MIEKVEANNSEGVQLQVLPNGRMTCWVDGVALQPTPAWLCRQVVIQTGRQNLRGSDLPSVMSGCPDKPQFARTDDQLYSEGLRVLNETAPCSLQISFAMLHSCEEKSS